MDANGLRKALADVFLRLNNIAGLVVEFPYLADTLPAPGSTGARPCCITCCALGYTRGANRSSSVVAWAQNSFMKILNMKGRAAQP